jgi:DNA-binding CsgD family transcriptional regulator
MSGVVFGRDSELEELDATLARARDGFAALVLEGDPGIGKTTVWRAGIARAANRGYQVLSCRTAPAETRLSFSALGDLLAPVEPAAFAALPDPQRDALEAALLRSNAARAAPNPRAIGTGIVSLLSALARSAPVVVAIDDLQWLDLPTARALEFAFRRLGSQRVALLATRRSDVRDTSDEPIAVAPDDAVHSLRLGPLGVTALYQIIELRLGQRLARPLLVRIERACGGNAFLALEIARALAVDGWAERGELPISADLHQLVAARLRQLPRRTREALLRASALAQPTIAAVDPSALVPAEDAGLVRIGADGRIEFSHPLFAAGVYAAESRDRKRRLHAKLALAELDVEERARHLMLARTRDGEDERVAAALGDAAEHAVRRGACEVAAELAEQSARLTPARRVEARRQRQLRAARHYLKAGDPARAKVLCEALLATSPPDPLRARALHRLAEAAIMERPESGIPLLEAALACAGDDVHHTAELENALGALLLLTLDLARSYDHLTRAVELAERVADGALVAEAIAMRSAAGLLCGKGLDEDALRRALALEDPAREVPFQIRTSINVACAYEYAARFDVARAHFVRVRESVIARGEEADLPWVLAHLAASTGMGGDLAGGEREASEAERAAAITGSQLFRTFALMVRANLRAMRGDAIGARADAHETLELSERLRWPIGQANGRWSLGLLALSEGEPEAALAWLGPLAAVIEGVGVYEWPIAMALPDAIEALIATGDLERATRLTAALEHWGRRFDRAWALATAGRCEALLAAADGDLERAAAATGRALRAHELLPMPFERARTLLVQGQLQRRSGERRSARSTLAQSHAQFLALGASLWAERAAGELARIGVRRAPSELTTGEQRVAELAARGLSNPEIAAQLFMSRRTVEANLARAYRKLGIGSRAELGATMARRGRSPQ